jgi:hypothetical protein
MLDPLPRRNNALQDEAAPCKRATGVDVLPKARGLRGRAHSVLSALLARAATGLTRGRAIRWRMEGFAHRSNPDDDLADGAGELVS